MGFRLVPKSVILSGVMAVSFALFALTLNDLERHNGHYFALFRLIR